jgi:hypothetical protein
MRGVSVLKPFEGLLPVAESGIHEGNLVAANTILLYVLFEPGDRFASVVYTSGPSIGITQVAQRIRTGTGF